MKDKIEKYLEQLSDANNTYKSILTKVYNESLRDLKEAVPSIEDIVVVMESSYNDEGGTTHYLSHIDVIFKKTPEILGVIKEKEINEDDFSSYSEKLIFELNEDEENTFPLTEKEYEDLYDYYEFIYSRKGFLLDLDSSNEIIISEIGT